MPLKLSAFPKCYLDKIAGERSMTVFEWIEEAKQLDADGLEMYEGFFPSLDPGYLDSVADAIRAAGFAMPMLCCSPDFTNPDADARTRAIDREIEMVRVCHRLGGVGTVCRVLSGQRYPDVGREQGLQWAAECITAVLPAAREHGVILGLENHYKDGFWKFPEFAKKMDVFLALLNAIPRAPNFGVNYDPSNAIIAGDDPIALLEAVKDRVVTMHASDRFFEGGTVEDLRKLEAHPQAGYAPILKHGVVGRGLNDYDKIFSILKRAGFNGWISIEDGEDFSLGWEHLRLSAEFLRAKMAQHELI